MFLRSSVENSGQKMGLASFLQRSADRARGLPSMWANVLAVTLVAAGAGAEETTTTAAANTTAPAARSGFDMKMLVEITVPCFAGLSVAICLFCVLCRIQLGRVNKRFLPTSYETADEYRRMKRQRGPAGRPEGLPPPRPAQPEAVVPKDARVTSAFPRAFSASAVHPAAAP